MLKLLVTLCTICAAVSAQSISAREIAEINSRIQKQSIAQKMDQYYEAYSMSMLPAVYGSKGKNYAEWGCCRLCGADDRTFDQLSVPEQQFRAKLSRGVDSGKTMCCPNCNWPPRRLHGRDKVDLMGMGLSVSDLTPYEIQSQLLLAGYNPTRNGVSNDDKPWRRYQMELDQSFPDAASFLQTGTHLGKAGSGSGSDSRSSSGSDIKEDEKEKMKRKLWQESLDLQRQESLAPLTMGPSEGRNLVYKTSGWLNGLQPGSDGGPPQPSKEGPPRFFIRDTEGRDPPPDVRSKSQTVDKPPCCDVCHPENKRQKILENAPDQLRELREVEGGTEIASPETCCIPCGFGDLPSETLQNPMNLVQVQDRTPTGYDRFRNMIGHPDRQQGIGGVQEISAAEHAANIINRLKARAAARKGQTETPSEESGTEKVAEES